MKAFFCGGSAALGFIGTFDWWTCLEERGQAPRLYLRTGVDSGGVLAVQDVRFILRRVLPRLVVPRGMMHYSLLKFDPMMLRADTNKAQTCCLSTAAVSP